MFPTEFDDSRQDLAIDPQWLIQLALEGDERAIKEVVGLYYPELVALTSKFSLDRKIELYAVQEAFCKILQTENASITPDDFKHHLLDSTLEICGKLNRIGRPNGREIRQGEDRYSPDSTVELSQPEIASLQENVYRELIVAYRRKKVLQRLYEIAFAGLILVAVGGFALWMRSQNREVETPVASITTQIVKVSVTTAPAITVTPFPANAVYYKIEQAQTLRQAADKIQVPVSLLSVMNGMTSDQQLAVGQRIMVGIGAPPVKLITPTPVTPVPTIDLLSQNSDSVDILARIQSSSRFWHTLWLDASVAEYGPPEYVGPPQIHREQIWVSQPFESALISGPYGGKPAEFWQINETRVLQNNLITGENNRYVGGGGLFSIRTSLAGLIFPANELHNITPENIQVVGEETIARRKAFVLDVFGNDNLMLDDNQRVPWRMARYWVDAEKGVLLRRQLFYRENGMLIEDIILNRINFDENFPNDLFNSDDYLVTDFVGDYTANSQDLSQPIPMPVFNNAIRASRTRIPPPVGYDPTKGTLTLEFTRADDLDIGPYYYSIFADGYYLADINLGSLSSKLICTRSADGNFLAYLFGDSQTYTSHIHWIDLHQPNLIQQVPEEININFLSGSPSSHTVAFLGCYPGNGYCYIGSLDLLTGQIKLLHQIQWGFALAWNPDGSQLAMLGSVNEVSGEQIIIFDAHSGDIIQSRSYPGQGDIPADSVLNEWGIKFPPADDSLEQCQAPPDQ
jgi:LysM repeat protein